MFSLLKIYDIYMTAKKKDSVIIEYKVYYCADCYIKIKKIPKKNDN